MNGSELNLVMPSRFGLKHYKGNVKGPCGLIFLCRADDLIACLSDMHRFVVSESASAASGSVARRGVLMKPKKLVDAGDVLTASEAVKVREGEAQLKRGQSRAWSAVKHDVDG